MPVSDTGTRPSGIIRPTAMEKFSGTVIDDAPLWFVTNPKDSNTYWYSADGKIGTIDSSLSAATLNSDTALTSAKGNGAAYYDNYIYFAKNADVARYGPLDGTPALTQNFWTSTLSLTAPNNKTYPSLQGVEIPNHPMHRNVGAQKLYFGDVDANNQGIISYVSTTKTTVEGDTNDSSAYAALTFDYGMWPTDIETYGSQLAIALIQGVNTTVRQNPATIAFWNRTSSDPSQYISVELSDPFITALENVNGVLYAFTGTADGGCRVLAFQGGYSFREVAYLPDTTPPMAGATDHLLNRVVWGGQMTTPESAACVYALGAKEKGLPMGVQNILKSSSSGATQNVTALAYVQDEAQIPQPIVGWNDGTSQGADKLSTTYDTSMIRSPLWRIGQPFEIKRIRIPLATAVGTNHTMTVKALFDTGSTTKTIATVTNTAPYSGKYHLDLVPQGSNAYQGESDFFIELRQTGSALLSVNLPITIEVETIE